MQIPKGGVFFFDSGIGGLSVLAECARKRIDLPFYYYGDNVNAPYGNDSPERIYSLVQQAIENYLYLKPSAIVLACNTVTAVCVDRLRKEYPIPIIGTEPAVLPASKKGGEIYILTTRATYACARFQTLCKKTKKAYPNATFTFFPQQRLAGEIEKHLLDKNFDFTPFFPPGTPDSVVLGCTHYVYLKGQIKDFYGCDIFDGNAGVAGRLFSLFPANSREERPLATPLPNCGQFSPIFFLGGALEYNKRVYEQMFAKTSVFDNKSG